MNFVELGAQLKAQRGETSLRALAEELGTSASTLSRLERGQVPSGAALSAVLHYLGMDLPQEEIAPTLELGVMQECAKSLMPLDAEARLRVLTWLTGIFSDGEEERKT